MEDGELLAELPVRLVLSLDDSRPYAVMGPEDGNREHPIPGEGKERRRVLELLTGGGLVVSAPINNSAGYTRNARAWLTDEHKHLELLHLLSELLSVKDLLPGLVVQRECGDPHECRAVLFLRPSAPAGEHCAEWAREHLGAKIDITELKREFRKAETAYLEAEKLMTRYA